MTDDDGQPSECVLKCQCLPGSLFSLKEPVYQCCLSHPLAACVMMIFIARKMWQDFCGLEELYIILVIFFSHQ